MSETTSALPNSGSKTLADRIDAYLATQPNLSRASFAARCGVSAATLYKLRDGGKVRQRNLERIEAVLEGRDSGGVSTSTESVLDPATKIMAQVLIEFAGQNNAYLALINHCFRRITEQLGPEAAETVTTQVLWSLLAGINDPEVCVKQLYELHREVAKD